MALGQGQGGGLMGYPDVPEIGPATWAQLSAMHPDSPLVGGRGVPSGGVDPDYKYHRVALSGPSSQPMPGAERIQGHPLELLNLKHNPIGWVLIAALLYLGLVHLHVNGRVAAGAGVGK